MTSRPCLHRVSSPNASVAHWSQPSSRARLARVGSFVDARSAHVGAARANETACRCRPSWDTSGTRYCAVPARARCCADRGSLGWLYSRICAKQRPSLGLREISINRPIDQCIRDCGVVSIEYRDTKLSFQYRSRSLLRSIVSVVGSVERSVDDTAHDDDGDDDQYHRHCRRYRSSITYLNSSSRVVC